MPASAGVRGRARAVAGRATVPLCDTLAGEGCSSASANSFAVAKRSAGSFCSAVSTACSTAGGTVSRMRVGGTGFSVIALATMACTVLPVKGGSPTSIS